MITITRINPTAPKIENSIRRGGMVAISCIAFSATSRGWILGFSSFRSSFHEWACANGCSSSAASGTSGAKTGSLSGGISARSEKLFPAELATGSDVIGSDTAGLDIVGPDIIGSKATRGERRSVFGSTAADKTGAGAT